MDDLERLKDLQRVLSEGGNGQGQLTHIRRDYCKEMADVLGRHLAEHVDTAEDEKIGGTCWESDWLVWKTDYEKCQSLLDFWATYQGKLTQDDFF